MTTYAWPTTLAHPWVPDSCEWGRYGVGSQAESFFSGFVQSQERPNTKWSLMLHFPVHTYAQRSQLEGWLNRLGGQEHRAALWDFVRPQPFGTVGAVVGATVAVTAVQFAKSIQLAGLGATKTLLQGDKFSVTTSTGVQVCMVATDVTTAAGGTATVEITQSLRGSVAAASAVNFTKPNALFILKDPNFKAPYDGSNKAPAFGVEFVESFV